MKLFKALTLGVALVSINVLAMQQTLTIGEWTTLPECGGSVKVTRSGNGSGEQVNLVFRDITECSNFDIVGNGWEAVDYRNRKIPETGHGRSGSFTLPKSVLDHGLNDIHVVVKSNSGKHREDLNIAFVAAGSRRHVEVDPVPVVREPEVHGSY